MGRSPSRNPSDEIEGLKKGPWSSQEDQLLIDYIHKHGPGNWQLLPKRAGLNRCGKSCRLRWTNYLRPDIKRGNFLPEEEQTIIDLHSSLGNKWSMIARRLPGRTDNEIKNFWNTRLRKKLLFSRIDPNTHRPIPDSVLPGNLIHNPLESLASIRLLHDMLQMLNYFHRPQDAMSSPLHVAPADMHLPFLNNLGMPLEFDPGNRTGTMNAIDSSEQCLPGLVPVPTGPGISSGDQVLDSGSSAVMDEEPGDSFWRDILVESFFDPLD